MGYEAGELKVFNPNREISKEITLEILIRHRDALKQARTGVVGEIEANNLGDNERKLNQARALNLIIASQREMITISRPIIFFKSTQHWKKKQQTEEDQKEHPFEEDDNDYKKLNFWLSFLKECQQAILTAEKTKRLDDDFLLEKDTPEGKVFELTQNFYDMIEDLESSYEQIYLLMLVNKIVSAGIEEDEEKTYKEKEEEAVRRIVDA